jgi:hypothetical protein
MKDRVAIFWWGASIALRSEETVTWGGGGHRGWAPQSKAPHAAHLWKCALPVRLPPASKQIAVGEGRRVPEKSLNCFDED